MVDFHEIQQGCHATEGDLDAICLNPRASTIPERFTTTVRNVTMETKVRCLP
jgi:hypothetical protein